MKIYQPQDSKGNPLVNDKELNAAKAALNLRIDETNQTFNERIESTKEELSNKIDDVDDKVDDLNSKLGEAEGDFDAKLQSAQDTLNAKIDGVQETLDEKINDVNKTLDQKIDDTNRNLSNKIDDVDRKLDAKIDSTKVDLEGQVRDAKAALNDKIDTTKSELQTELHTTRDTLNNKIDQTKTDLQNELHTTRDTLNSKIDDTKNTLDAKIDSTEEKLNTKIETTETKLDTKIDETKKELDTKIDEVDTRLDTKITEVDNRLDAKITEADTRLNAKIDEVDTRLDTKIDTTEDKLEAEINDAKTTLNNKIEATETKLNDKIDATDTKLNAKIDNTEIRLDTKIDGVEDRLETELNQAKDTLNAKIDQTRSDLDASIQSTQSTLNTKIDDTRTALDNKIDTTKSDLEAKLKGTEAKFDEELDTVEKSLNTKIDETKNGLEDKITASEGRVNTRIDVVEKSLEEQIRDTKSELATDITRVETTLNDKIDSSKDWLNNKIDTAKDQLNDKIDTAKDQLTAKIDNVKDNLTTDLRNTEQRLTEKIDANDVKTTRALDAAKTELTTKIDENAQQAQQALEEATSDLQTQITTNDTNIKAALEQAKQDLQSSIDTNVQDLTTTFNEELDKKADKTELQSAKEEITQAYTDAIADAVGTVFNWKGTVADILALKEKEVNAHVGDVWNVEDTGANYVWSGTAWDKLSENLEGFALRTDVNAHISNDQVHFTGEEKSTWDTAIKKNTQVITGLTNLTETHTNQIKALQQKDVDIDNALATKANQFDLDKLKTTVNEKVDNTTFADHLSNQDVHFIDAIEKNSWKKDIDNTKSGLAALGSDFQMHTKNSRVHFVNEEKAEWREELNTANSDIMVLKAKTQQNTNNLTILESRVETNENNLTDHVANVTNMHFAEGEKAVFEKDIQDNKAAIATKADASKVDELEQKVDEFIGGVAQEWNTETSPESVAPQSGKAVKGAIDEALKSYTTSDDLTDLLADKANVSDLETKADQAEVNEKVSELTEALEKLTPSIDFNSHATNNSIHIKEETEHSLVNIQSNLASDGVANYASCAFTPFYSGALTSAKFFARPNNISAKQVYCQIYRATEKNAQGIATAVEYVTTSDNAQMLSNNAELVFNFSDATMMIDGELYLMQFVTEADKTRTDMTSSVQLQLNYFSMLTANDQRLENTPQFYSNTGAYNVGAKAPWFPKYEFTFTSPLVYSADGKTRLSGFDLYYKTQLNRTENVLNKHIADKFRHTTKDQLLEATSYENIITKNSVAGTEDKTFNYCNIYDNIPEGRLRRVTMKAQQAGTITGSTISCYLSVYELSEDGTEYVYMGTSDNGAVQAVGKDCTWNFANSHIDLEGRGIRLYLTNTPTYPLVKGLKFAAHCSAGVNAKTTIVLSDESTQFTPEITWGIDIRREMFAPIEHTRDTSIHFTADEKQQMQEKLEAKADNSTVTQLQQSVETLTEKAVVDQKYNSVSENAQSGTAVAEAIAGLATKEELASKVDQTTYDSDKQSLEASIADKVDQSTYASDKQSLEESIEGKVDQSTYTTDKQALEKSIESKADSETVTQLQQTVTTLTEKVTIDQEYQATSENAQSGKAVAEAVKQHADDTTVHVTAEEKSNWATKEYVNSVTSGLPSEGKITELSNQVTQAKADLTAHTGNTEIHFTDNSEKTTLLADVAEIKARKVDAEYVSETSEQSANAQSGKAVKGMIDSVVKDYATSVSVTSDIEAAKTELDGKIAKKADSSALSTLQEQVSSKAEESTVTALQGTVSDIERQVEALEAGTVVIDNTYDSSSEHAISGKGVADALTKYTTTESLTALLADKANSEALTELEGRLDQYLTTEAAGQTYATKQSVTELTSQVAEKIDEATVDSKLEEYATTASVTSQVETLNSSISTAQSAAEKAQTDLTAHTSDDTKHVTTEDKTKWNNKVDTSTLQSAISTAKETITSEYKDAINKAVGTVFTWKGTKETLAEVKAVESPKVGDVYNVTSEGGANYVYSGDSQTGDKGWDKLSENLEGLATDEDLTNHTSNQNIHFTEGEKQSILNQLDEKASQSELSKYALQSAVNTLQSTVDGHTESIESLTSSVDEKIGQTELDTALTKYTLKTTFDSHDQNTIKHITATERTTWNAKADKTALDTLTTQVNAKLNSADVDQTFASASTHPQSGKAIKAELDKLDTKITTNKTTVDNHIQNTTIHVTNDEKTKLASCVISTDVTKILVFTDPSQAPELSQREAGVLYLIAEAT